MLVAFAKLQGYDDAKIKRLSEVLQRSTDLDEGIKDKVAVAGETEESVYLYDPTGPQTYNIPFPSIYVPIEPFSAAWNYDPLHL
jgi:hypothetical protein